MKKIRFTEERMVKVLREADASPVAEVAKQHNISEQTLYPWRKRFGPLQASEVKRLKQLSAEYPRYGYRRIRIFLRRQGHAMSRERCHRLWRVAGLQVPRKRPRQRIARSRPRSTSPLAANHVWAYDFVFDATAAGQPIKCLAIDVAGTLRSARVIEVLKRLISERGPSRSLRSDNGPEFVSHAILQWIADEGLLTALNDPGKPWQNGADESFNGKFRDECPSIEYFRSRAEARAVIENWRQHYNAVRPHSSLDYLTPNKFTTKLKTSFHTQAGVQ